MNRVKTNQIIRVMKLCAVCIVSTCILVALLVLFGLGEVNESTNYHLRYYFKIFCAVAVMCAVPAMVGSVVLRERITKRPDKRE